MKGGTAGKGVFKKVSRKIGLLDVDGHNFPNIPLMKLSAWHKAQGDTVEWYNPFLAPYDVAYLSKVFSFTPDYEHPVYADKVIKGGSGYCISCVDDREVYDRTKDAPLPDDVEHGYPDYSLYGITDTAYGYLTRGCPRGCSFCHTGAKDGLVSRKVADLSEFWNGQRNIVLLDQNILACRDWADLLDQLIDSRACVEFNGGMDIRIMTEQKAERVKRIRVKRVHFAWDRYEDGNIIIPRLRMFKELTGWDRRKMIVYCLVNFDTTIEQDLERIYTIRDLGYDPYVMVYDKASTASTDTVRRLQRWANSPQIFNTVKRFEDYK